MRDWSRHTTAESMGSNEQVAQPCNIVNVQHLKGCVEMLLERASTSRKYADEVQLLGLACVLQETRCCGPTLSKAETTNFHQAIVSIVALGCSDMLVYLSNTSRSWAEWTPLGSSMTRVIDALENHLSDVSYEVLYPGDLGSPGMTALCVSYDSQAGPLTSWR